MNTEKMPTKRAQIRMTETIAVLFIFFILLGFGIIFYAQYQQAAFKEKRAELIANKAMDISAISLFLPELICSDGFQEVEQNCIDMMKLRNVEQTIAEHTVDYYFDIFSFAKIQVIKTYPEEEETFPIYERQPTEEGFNYEPTYFVVALRDDKVDSYYFGYLEVGVYS